MRANYLASPPLVVAYALAGRIDIDLTNEPLGTDKDGQPGLPARHLADPDGGARRRSPPPSRRRCSSSSYADVFEGDERWHGIAVPRGRPLRLGRQTRTYVRTPPYFDDMPDAAAARVAEIEGARVLAVLGDSITTDHISPGRLDQGQTRPPAST